MNLLKKDIIFSDVNKLKGVGKQLSKYLKNKKIEKFDTDKGGLDHETAEKNNSETHKKDHVSVRGVSPTLVTEIAEEEVDSDDE